MHKRRDSIPRVGGGGTSYNGLYGEAPPERGTLFTLQVYERVGISRVEVYERVGKSVIYVFKRAFHQNKFEDTYLMGVLI